MNKNKYNKKLGELVKIRRTKKLLTQQELSDLVKIHRVSIARIESGNYNLMLTDGVNLANVLNIKLQNIKA